MTRLITCCLLLGSLPGPPCPAAETVVKVELKNGRTFQGTLDARSNDESLWLRWRVGTAQLQRGIAWNELTAATIEGTPIAIAQLKEQAAARGTPGIVKTPSRAKPNLPPFPPVSAVPPALSVVETISCDAWLANWNADALLDGVVLQVTAYDRDGLAVPFQGTVAAELMSLDYLPGYLASSRGGRVPVALGRWSQPWHAETRCLRLEYPGRSPQLDGSLDRYALLKVRVSIPGHGVFDRVVHALRLRPFTPVVDALAR